MANSSGNEIDRWLNQVIAQRADALDADPTRALTGAELRKRLFAARGRKPVKDG